MSHAPDDTICTVCLSEEEIRHLCQEQETPCVSLFLPIHRSGHTAKDMSHRLHTLVDTVAKKLSLYGLNDRAVTQFLAQLRSHADSAWEMPEDAQSVGFFLSPSNFSHLYVSAELKEKSVVAKQFHLTPLLHLLMRPAGGYMLAASKGKVRMIHITPGHAQEMNVKNMSISLEEFTARTERQEREIQSHGSTEGAIHGHGGGKDLEKKEAQRFFADVGSCIDEALNGLHDPLALVGTEEDIGMLKSAIRYPHLAQEFLHGNPDDMPVGKIAMELYPLLESYWEGAEKSALEWMGTQMAEEKASTDLAEIVQAARGGKVDELLVKKGGEQWGHIQGEGSDVSFAEEHDEGSSELLSDAAVHTIRNGGKVLAIDPSMMDDDLQAAAVLRYA